MERKSTYSCDKVIRFFDLDFDIINAIENMKDELKYLIFYKKTPFGGQVVPLSGKRWKLIIPEIKNPKIKLI